MPRKKTHEEFVKEVYDLVGDEYTVLGKYINTSTNIEMKHNKCNNIWKIKPSNFIKGNRCPKCNIIKRSNKKRKTHEEFVKEVYDLVGDEYTVLGKYPSNNKISIDMKHNKCNNIFKMSPHNFLSQNQRCPKCQHPHSKKTHEEFVKEVYDLVGDEYTVLGKYGKGNKEKIKLKHNKCNYEYNVSPNRFLSGDRCPKCFGTIKKTHEEFVKEVYDLVGDEYTVLGKYINADTKILMLHNKCKNKYPVSPSGFLRGNRCPECKNSIGEERIKKWLTKNNIKFKHRFYFPDCKYINPLQFDFRILCENPNDYILIEFDGEQHTNPDCYYNKINPEKFELAKIRDKIKDDYCASHDNIDLYRIPYTKFDSIEEELEKIFNNYE